MLAIYIALYLILSLPVTQKWLAGRVADFLSSYFDTEVDIGRVQLSLSGHVIIDDFVGLDQSQRQLISATRIGAEISIRRYLEYSEIIINSAQLYGATGYAVQEHKDSAFNYQFIVDRLSGKSSNKKKKKPHIEVRAIMIRHANLFLDKQWQPYKDGFDANHIALSDLSATGVLNVFDNDTLCVSLRRLSFTEKCGLSVTKGSGIFTKGPDSGYNLKNLHLALNTTELDIPLLSYNEGVGKFNLSASVLPSEFTPFYSRLENFNSLVYLNTKGNYDKNNLTVSQLNIDESMGAFSTSIDGNVSIKEFVEKFTSDSIKAKKSLALTTDTKSNTASTRSINAIISSLPDFNININKVAVDPGIEQFINPFLKAPVKLLSQLGESSCKGTLEHSNKFTKADISLKSGLGNVELDGVINEDNIRSVAKTEKLQLGKIISLGSDSLGILKSLTATIDVKGKLSGRDGFPEGHLKAIFDEIGVKGYDYHGIIADVSRHGSVINLDVDSDDPAAFGNISASINTDSQSPSIQGLVDLSHLNLQKTNLVSQKSPIKWIDTRVGVDLEGGTIDNLSGTISVPHVIIGGDSTVHTFTSVQLTSQPNGQERHIKLTSPYLNMKADGTFKFKDLIANLQKLGHNLFPSLIAGSQVITEPSDLSLDLKVIDPTPIRSVLGVDLYLDKGPLLATAALNTNSRHLETNLTAPSIRIGKQKLEDITFKLNNSGDDFQTDLHAQSYLKNVPIKLDVQALMSEQQIYSSIRWHADHDTRNEGEISCAGTVERRTKEGLVIYANVRPTEIYLNDTLWNMHPSQLYYRNNELYVDNFMVSMLGGSRSINIQGTASKLPTDTLIVDLKEIDLAYILSMAKLKPISLGGLATGRLLGHSLLSKPVATGHVTVPHFLFNEANMGALDADLSWNVTPGSLGLKGHVVDPIFDSDLVVNGDIHLLKDPTQFINLDINCKKANAAFMQRYVSGIMDDFEGRVSGTARIYGSFREIDLEGDVLVDEVGLTIPALNTRYRAYNERVQIRPGVIELNGIRAYDKYGGPNAKTTEHTAVVRGQLSHKHFNDLRFNIDIEGNNILAYDTHTFDDGAFYATCLGSGKVHLEGVPGNTVIDIDATPLRGTSLTYNAESPDALTHAGFLTFVDRSEMYLEKEENEKKKASESSSSDMHINFNVNLTPDAQLRLLMDAKTGDYITLYGSGQMGAQYYNKGNFLLFGTTKIDHGTYKLTLQDVIHKEFQLRQGGTIVFNGAPMQADLNLQAVYSVPSVSLNDLSMRGTFSNNNVRVNCLMNIDGKPSAPHLTFDFELPNVNEEEARMVRSLISTEEERNLQVVYLLGIGRFYTYDYASVQDQSSTAVNSLLSTTISGQINQVMSSIIGSSDWNFGANVATGNNGWDDVDVEGMLSGRMLNNRLIFNGNFGYRDNPVAQSNFVGDFDLQWLLTKNGNLVLKAYSETNDRYFTKSSLTTQGVGIMAKKDFSSFRDFRVLNLLRKRKINKPQK